MNDLSDLTTVLSNYNGKSSHYNKLLGSLNKALPDLAEKESGKFKVLINKVVKFLKEFPDIIRDKTLTDFENLISELNKYSEKINTKSEKSEKRIEIINSLREKFTSEFNRIKAKRNREKEKNFSNL